MARPCFWSLVMALALLAPVATPLAQGQQPGKKHHKVVIEAMRFEPPVLKLAPGDVVEWVNKDPFPHTATAKGKFDTGEIPPEGSRSVRVTGSGNITYLCTLHPTMKGSLELP